MVSTTVIAEIEEDVMLLIEAKQADILRLNNRPGKCREAALAVLLNPVNFSMLHQATKGA